MFTWLYLVYGVLVNVAIWPINKWGLKQNGVESVLGFWNVFAMLIISFIVLCVYDVNFFMTPKLMMAGFVSSIVYSIGFLIIIMHCLKIGPSGLTMTVNNSAMIFGIIYSFVYLKPETPGILVMIGIIGVLISIVFIGISKETDTTKQFNYSKWYKLVIAGGLFSGISFMTQSYVSYIHPGPLNTMLFIFWANLLSSIILFTISFVRKSKMFSKREMRAGLSTSICNLSGNIPIFLAIGIYGSAITFPIVICIPIVIMLFIGRFIYNEKLSKTSYTGAIMAVISILLITISSN
jgi:drug/metabolite transporter (DMT)-like permease